MCIYFVYIIYCIYKISSILNKHIVLYLSLNKYNNKRKINYVLIIIFMYVFCMFYVCFFIF